MSIAQGPIDIDKVWGAKSAGKETSADRVAPEMGLDATGTSAKSRRIAVEVSALREAGCVAEETQGRLFAGQYREIKRKIIETALLDKSDKSQEQTAPPPLIVVVTSALPGDGKTFTSINLALSSARERDVSVLLVDGDVQKADVSRLFGIRDRPGLLDALSDEAVDIESLILRTNLPGLTLLSAGTFSEGATELLSSARMQQIAAGLVSRNSRRIVLMDAPPLLMASETRSLMKIAGQIALVIRSGKTPRAALQDALHMLDEHRTVGLILNEAQPSLVQGYYGYGYYGFEYGNSTPKS
jgi:protein-tyrosine kinase